MFGAGKDADKALEDALKSALRLLQWKLRHRELLTDDGLQFGDQLHDQLAIRAKRFHKVMLPPAQLCLALAQERSNEALERLRKRRVRSVPLVLVELA